jgi:hypothetical protein
MTSFNVLEIGGTYRCGGCASVLLFDYIINDRELLHIRYITGSCQQSLCKRYQVRLRVPVVNAIECEVHTDEF